jgi:hypothetical protein
MLQTAGLSFDGSASDGSALAVGSLFRSTVRSSASTVDTLVLSETTGLGRSR